MGKVCFYFFVAVFSLTCVPAWAELESGGEPEPPLSPRKWIEHWHVLKDKLDSAIPKPLAVELYKAAPQFCAFPLDEHFESALAQGDFNCDGRPDIAVVGIPLSDPLAKHFCTAGGGGELGHVHQELSDTEVLALKSQIDNYMLRQAGTVWVGLTQAKGPRKWFEESASQIRYQLGDCGCCTKTPKKQRQAMRNKRCGFLFFGCCEKAGRYVLYQKNSTAVRMRDACP